MKKNLLIFIFILAMSEFMNGASLYLAPTLGSVRYVTQTGGGSKNGTDWINAYDNTQLQTAINETGVTEVWVAAGTYKPTLLVGGTTTRYLTFQMKNGVAIYGGFGGTETSLSQRNWTSNVTILSGDISGDDVVTGSGASLSITGNTENCLNVFNHPSTLALTSSAILDGFTIKGGNASGDKGGGMYNNNSSPTIANCNFTSNSSYYGGGISNNSHSSPTLTNCKISGNNSTYGGGVDNFDYSSPILTNCTIANNYAGYFGGGLYMQFNCSISLINCLIVFNNAAYDGGGIDNTNYSTLSLVNCTVSGNSASRNGGGLYLNAPTTLNNSIIWGNSALTSGHEIYNSGYATSLNNSCYANGTGDVKIESGTFTPANCITTDPQFINPNTDFRIAATSPCADAGNDTYNSQATDIRGAGFARKLSKTAATSGTIDMGAYEYKYGTDPAVPTILRLYVKSDASGLNDGSSWTNAYKSLQDAIAAAGRNYEIWVAAGTYKPTTGTDRSISFRMKTALAIYGGFAGNETALSARNWTSNPTILSGDLIGNDGISGSGATLAITGNTENSYHVVYVPVSVAMTSRSGSPAILDGFTLQGGNAMVYPGISQFGGGLYIEGVTNATKISSFSMINCIVTANSATYGGGMYNNNYSTPMITNCIIANNLATYVGGVWNNTSSPTFTNCTISGNSSTSGYSGGLHNYMYSTLVMVNCKINNNYSATQNGNGGGLSNTSTSTASLTNCLITNNSAGKWGGGVYTSNNCILTMTNCTVSGNSTTIVDGAGYSGGGGGIYNYYSVVTLNNSIIWGNTSVNCSGYSAIKPSNQICNESNSAITFILNNSCYANGAGDVYNSASGGIITTNNCITTDPQFINPNTDFRIAAASPCADAGSDAYNSEAYDIRGIGFGRKLLKTSASAAGTIDIGAYEYKNGSDPTVPEVLRLYVKSDGSDSNNGNSWPNAFKTLQAALTVVGRNYEIWVAKGTYTPTALVGGTTSLFATFQLKNKLAIYGGFAGNETLLSQRDLKTNATILSGDINNDDNVSGSGKTLSINGNSENCYHVVSSLSYVDRTAILDGFTIKGGNANGKYGGGVYNFWSSPTLSNCIITSNSAWYGAGVGNYQYSSPAMTNCTIKENYNLYYGGGICNETSSSPIMVNCTISGNSASSGSGGAFYNNLSSSPKLTNCLIVNNYSISWGGAFYNYVSSPTLTNCTVSGNSASHGGGLFNSTSSTTTINNSIIWGNTAQYEGNQIFNYDQTAFVNLNYTCYANGTVDVNAVGTITPDANCINTNPKFVNASTGDFRIFNISKCADAGDNSLNSTTTEIRGTGFGRKLLKTDHTQPGIIDMGAYEYQESIDWGNPTKGGVIAGPASVCSGSASPEIKNTTPPSGHVGTLEYKWQVSTTSSTTGFEDVATNSPTYSPGVLTVPTWFKRLSKITLINDWDDAAVSNVLGITIDPPSFGGAVSGSDEVCSGTNSTKLTLSNQTGTVIKWQSSTDNWATFADITNVTTTLIATNLTTTTKYHAVVQSGVCDPKNSTDAIITVNPRPTAVITGGETYCNGQNTTTNLSLAFTGTGPWNGTLSNGATFSGTVSPISVSVTPVSTTTYTIATLSDTQCTASAGDLTGSATVTVNQRPMAVISGGATYCNGQKTTTLLSIAVKGTGPWNGTLSNGATFNGSDSPISVSVTPSSTTTYTVASLTDSQCTAIAGDLTGSATVTVNPLPAAAAGDDRAIIINNSTQIGAVAVSGSTYIWTSIPTGFNSTAANPTVSPLVTTTYTVTETNSTGCSNSHSVKVTVNAAYTASVSIGVDANNVCEGTSVIFAAKPTNGGTNPTYQWYKNTKPVETGESYSYTPAKNDQVYVVMTSNLPNVIGNPAKSNTIDLFINTTGQWLGITSNWNNANNWCGGVPNAFTNVIIPKGVIQPIIGVSVSASCNDINIEDGATLTLNSDENGTGSLIVSGIVSGSGTTFVHRYMTTGAWHIVASPVSGQSISNFLGTNAKVATDDENFRGMMDYNPTINDWNNYFTNSTSGNLNPGKGFAMRTNANSIVTFTGNLNSGNQTASVLESTLWNCIGNPYTSAIGINENSMSKTDFLTFNAANLDPSFGAVYVWHNLDEYNGVSGMYTVISNALTDVAFDVQQGQAFMVKMNTSASSVSFNSDMQIHNPGLELKSTNGIWSSLKVLASVNSQKSSTTIAFNSAMTKGLDRTYDAGLLRGGADLVLYSKLVEDNGIPFAIQALPDNGLGTMIIPLGVESKTGGEIVFSIESLNLPADCQVILEDKQSHTFTDLSTNKYTTNVAANSILSDRFSLNISNLNTKFDQESLVNKLSAYAVRNIEIRIKGKVSNQAVATLYDVQGREVLVKTLEEGSLNIVRTPNIKTAIYLLSVYDKGKIHRFKIPVNE